MPKIKQQKISRTHKEHAKQGLCY